MIYKLQCPLVNLAWLKALVCGAQSLMLQGSLAQCCQETGNIQCPPTKNKRFPQFPFEQRLRGARSSQMLTPIVDYGLKDPTDPFTLFHFGLKLYNLGVF